MKVALVNPPWSFGGSLFVRANLLGGSLDRRLEVAAWTDEARRHGVVVVEPAPLFPSPGSPGYTRQFGACDDLAWERAYAPYLTALESSNEPPIPMSELEHASAHSQMQVWS